MMKDKKIKWLEDVFNVSIFKYTLTKMSFDSTNKKEITKTVYYKYSFKDAYLDGNKINGPFSNLKQVEESIILFLKYRNEYKIPVIELLNRLYKILDKSNDEILKKLSRDDKENYIVIRELLAEKLQNSVGISESETTSDKNTSKKAKD